MKRLLFGIAFALAFPSAFSQSFPYQQPPETIRAVLDAKPLPARFIDPTGTTLAIAEYRRYPAIEQLSRPFLRLAGLRIDAAANGPQRVAHLNRLTMRALADASAPERAVTLPPDGDFRGFAFSPDGLRFTLLRTTATATELWVGDVATARLAKVSVALQDIDAGGIEAVAGFMTQIGARLVGAFDDAPVARQ